MIGALIVFVPLVLRACIALADAVELLRSVSAPPVLERVVPDAVAL